MFDWVVGIVRDGGYLGVFLLMFAENVFPPIPSEVIMPLAGFVAAGGDLDIALVILAGSLGSLAGAVFWYVIGLWLGNGRVEWAIRRFGRILTMNLDDLDKARAWFAWRAWLAVFLGRLVPTVRTLVSVPAGIAPMALAPFLFWTSLGTAIWTGLLALAGYLLEQRYVLIQDWVDPVSKVVVVLIVGFYLYRLVTYRPGRGSDA